jgi:starch synthase
MDILMVSPELSPLAKVGGLADVVLALSKALRGLGHRVTVALPKSPGVEGAGILLARRLTPVVLPAVGEGPRHEVTVYDGKLASGVELLVLDVPGTFAPGEGATDLYGGPPGETGEGPDGARRFGPFCRAVVELVRARRDAAAQGATTAFDVVHVHDWPAAPVAYLLNELEGARPRTVLTLHNLAHQGLFPLSAVAELGLGPDHLHRTETRAEFVEFYGKVSFLKAGIVAADVVTTVSPTYATEILGPERGERLDGVLRARKSPVVGIANAVDYAVWNPATDPALVARYDADEPSNKGRCKSALQDEVGLPIRPELPLLVSLGRVVPQKGADVLAAALPALLKNDVQVVVAGGGDPALLRALEAAVGPDADRAKVLGRVPEPLAHRLLAAADLVLMPSRYEPCGLVQLYAQRYGAAPIATRTGGFVDTIVDLDAELETGTGFLIDAPTERAVSGGVARALAALGSPRWREVRRRMMRLDLGWDRAARRYDRLYR